MDGTLRRTAQLSLAGGLFVIALAALVLPGLHRSVGSESVQESRAAESSARVLSNEPQLPDAKDAIVVAGRVLDPNGKPFSGAKLYAMVKSSMREAPKLKDPNTKVFETKTVDGKTEVYIVHPGLVAIMKKHGLDPAKPVSQAAFEKPEIFAEMQQFRQELYEENPYQMPTVRTTSGPDGKFHFTLAKSSLHKAPHEDVEVYAFADNFGPGWAWVSKDEELADLTVHLVEDTPINGRIIDLQGQPVAGVTVKLGTIMVGPDGGIKMWQELVKASGESDTTRFNELLPKMLERQMYTQNFTQIPKSVISNKEGRFSIRGIGANRVLFNVDVHGPTIGHDLFTVVTRADTGIKFDNPLKRPMRAEYRTYPASFDHIVNPLRVLDGTLRDSVTGKPVEGVQVAAWGPGYVDCFTDKQGRYKLVGLSKGTEYRVSIWPFNSQRKRLPYLNVSVVIRDTAGLEPITTDLNLVRGVVLRGQLNDTITGKPAGPAEVWYATFKDNPHVASFAYSGNPKFADRKEFIGLPYLEQTHTHIGPDGSFEMVVPPGRCVLGVRMEKGSYAPASLPEAEKERGFWEAKTVPLIAHSAKEFQAVRLIEVPDNVTEVKTELSVESVK